MSLTVLCHLVLFLFEPPPSLQQPTHSHTHTPFLISSTDAFFSFVEEDDGVGDAGQFSFSFSFHCVFSHWKERTYLVISALVVTLSAALYCQQWSYEPPQSSASDSPHPVLCCWKRNALCTEDKQNLWHVHPSDHPAANESILSHNSLMLKASPLSYEEIRWIMLHLSSFLSYRSCVLYQSFNQ